MSAKEKIAFLKGLLAGLNMKDETTVKAFQAVTEALDALAEEIEEHGDLIEEQQDLYEELADDWALLDEDLDKLERSFAEIVGEDFEGGEEEEESDFDETYESVSCPKCGHVFYYQPEMYEEDEPLQCPNCGESFALPAEE
ncbi:MAG TPA: hypothetical protein DEP01_06720 [Aminobacterium sp.]|jgi:rubrerythrin|uniref:CD1247 N-terminal domain-containing protein n=1 Tax=Aminobacterium TaxID=81466 RepID=UPI000ED3D7CF|nr:MULTISPECIES: CD1247 N-terminal domain-containing protein [unclassified Aminobacterium]HCA41188.1 hypothetical protein [Aminobacterium sp.]